ncbi:DUF418 domain-containing protein [Microtetraspora glauca]|uniref:DUF418 domain-containing protein n=1 Tax=Microtetraspora glauca TaxID=1996 RepID=A0ABV3G8U8_MICGL
MIHPAPRSRIGEIDALRGFAVCGMTVVNVWQNTLTHGRTTSIDWAMTSLAQSRFYPIFACLFGVGFALFLRSAKARADRPWLVALARLVVLALFGALHGAVNAGDVLLPYALIGLLVLLPAGFLAPPVVILVGTGIVAVSLTAGDPWPLIAGLFALGAGATAAVLKETAPEKTAPRKAARKATQEAPQRAAGPATGAGYRRAARRTGYVIFPLAASLTVVLTLRWNASQTGGLYLAAALSGAVAYATGFLLLTRAIPAVGEIFRTLGRMALTCYLTGTAVILATLPLLTADGSGFTVVAVSVLTIAGQVVLTRWWLARYRYGPLEWVWRRLTWWEPLPNRQTGNRDTRSPVPDPDLP